MTHWVVDDSPSSRMRLARNGAEFVLLGMREIRIEFDRKTVANHLQQALYHLYRAMDASADSLVQPEALEVATTALGAAVEVLQRTARRQGIQIKRAIDVLHDARAHASDAAQVVSMDQLNRRMELRWGIETVERPLRPFQASNARPQLHAIRRDPTIAPVDLGEADEQELPPPKVELDKAPVSLGELRELAQQILTKAAEVPEPEPNAAQKPEGALITHVTAGSNAETPSGLDQAEVALLAEFGRDAIENIASLGSLRHPIETESWLDQAPFEQRLLNQLDYFASLGAPGISAAIAYHAESDVPDPARAFALAFALGCLDGTDSVFAIVTRLRQSAPEEYLGFIEGLTLATNPNIVNVVRPLLSLTNLKLVGVGVAVLAAHRALTRAEVEAVLALNDPELMLAVARALGTNLSHADASELIRQQLDNGPSAPDVFMASIESGIYRGMNEARAALREQLAHPESGVPLDRVGALLGMCGAARDVAALVAEAEKTPSPLLFEGLGRLGHVSAIPLLLRHLDELDEELSPAAASALERITGAGLYDEVEEPWVKELPPEAAGMDVPIPMKRVKRITLDPVRWRAWRDERLAKPDPYVKYRHGKPFELQSIVDELAAREPNPAQRARAALEFRANAGIDVAFSPDDWVVSQEVALAAMREQAQSLAITPGAWCFAGAGRTATPSNKAPARAAKPVTAPVQEPQPGFELPVRLRSSQPSQPSPEPPLEQRSASPSPQFGRDPRLSDSDFSGNAWDAQLKGAQHSRVPSPDAVPERNASVAASAKTSPVFTPSAAGVPSVAKTIGMGSEPPVALAAAKLSLDELALVEAELETYPSASAQILAKHNVNARQLEVERRRWVESRKQEPELDQQYEFALSRYRIQQQMKGHFE